MMTTQGETRLGGRLLSRTRVRTRREGARLAAQQGGAVGVLVVFVLVESGMVGRILSNPDVQRKDHESSKRFKMGFWQ